MPRFAANLTLMYTELPFLERFAAAARDGFTGVEFLFPYAWPATELAARLRDNGLQQVLFNAPPGGADVAAMSTAWERGERGTACLPGREAEFRAGVLQALEYAVALDCPRIHLMAGCVPSDPGGHAGYAGNGGGTGCVAHDGNPRGALHDTLVANLAWAARQAAAAGRQVMVEPINGRDMPGYFLQYQEQAHAIVQVVGADNLKVQMDLYHCQVMEGDVATRIRHYLPTGRVGHFQMAGVPERHEPDTGELNFVYLLDVIDTVAAGCGWDGWVGCEYRPRANTSAGLGWLRRWQSSSPQGRGREMGSAWPV